MLDTWSARKDAARQRHQEEITAWKKRRAITHAAQPQGWPLADYLKIWRDVRPTCQGRAEIVRAMAHKTNCHERSIRRWPKLYDFPLYETVAEYEATVDTFGQNSDINSRR